METNITKDERLRGFIDIYFKGLSGMFAYSRSIYVYDEEHYTAYKGIPKVGDKVRVTGWVHFYNQIIELEFDDNVTYIK